MARSQTAAAPAATKTHRPTRRVTKKEPVAAAEFNPAEYHDDIAAAAYLIWLERGDASASAEENWLQAEAEVRSRFLQS